MGSGAREVPGYSVEEGKWCKGCGRVQCARREVVQGRWRGTVWKKGSGAREVAGYSVEGGKWCKGGAGQLGQGQISSDENLFHVITPPPPLPPPLQYTTKIILYYPYYGANQIGRFNIFRFYEPGTQNSELFIHIVLYSIIFLVKKQFLQV